MPKASTRTSSPRVSVKATDARTTPPSSEVLFFIRRRQTPSSPAFRTTSDQRSRCGRVRHCLSRLVSRSSHSYARQSSRRSDSDDRRRSDSHKGWSCLPYRSTFLRRQPHRRSGETLAVHIADSATHAKQRRWHLLVVERLDDHRSRPIPHCQRRQRSSERGYHPRCRSHGNLGIGWWRTRRSTTTTRSINSTDSKKDSLLYRKNKVSMQVCTCRDSPSSTYRQTRFLALLFE